MQSNSGWVTSCLIWLLHEPSFHIIRMVVRILVVFLSWWLTHPRQILTDTGKQLTQSGSLQNNTCQCQAHVARQNALFCRHLEG